ncbi:hypothetical protein PVAND_006053 [Polypedilum vanderplanki]|uniref:Uncharacterized protein n=1 Tax=Polypedilum vanderplanki TaxID=319348 RepID=A0A9J6C1Z8_POLVA|nr:hypothetical protein PVAND_006053 [Polypedilum vanderplanki]
MDTRWFREKQDFPPFNANLGYLSSTNWSNPWISTNEKKQFISPQQFNQNAQISGFSFLVLQHGQIFNQHTQFLPLKNTISAFHCLEEVEPCEYKCEKVQRRNKVNEKIEESKVYENLVQNEEKSTESCRKIEGNQEKIKKKRRKNKKNLKKEKNRGNEIDYEVEINLLADWLESLHINTEKHEHVDEPKSVKDTNSDQNVLETEKRTKFSDEIIRDLRDLHLAFKNSNEPQKLCIKFNFISVSRVVIGVQQLLNLFSLAIPPNRKSRKKIFDVTLHFMVNLFMKTSA